MIPVFYLSFPSLFLFPSFRSNSYSPKACRYALTLVNWIERKRNMREGDEWIYNLLSQPFLRQSLHWMESRIHSSFPSPPFPRSSVTHPSLHQENRGLGKEYRKEIEESEEGEARASQFFPFSCLFVSSLPLASLCHSSRLFSLSGDGHTFLRRSTAPFGHSSFIHHMLIPKRNDWKEWKDM